MLRFLRVKTRVALFVSKDEGSAWDGTFWKFRFLLRALRQSFGGSAFPGGAWERVGNGIFDLFAETYSVAIAERLAASSCINPTTRSAESCESGNPASRSDALLKSCSPQVRIKSSLSLLADNAARRLTSG